MAQYGLHKVSGRLHIPLRGLYKILNNMFCPFTDWFYGILIVNADIVSYLKDQRFMNEIHSPLNEGTSNMNNRDWHSWKY